MSDTTIHIARIPENRRLEAARLIAGPGADKHAAGRFLQAADSHGVGLDEFWGLSQGLEGRLLACALFAPSAGGTYMTFTSPIRNDQAASRVALILDRACMEMAPGKLAQVLLEASEKEARGAFGRARFEFVGELLYLRRLWMPAVAPPSAWPAGVTIAPWRDSNDAELAIALERTYVDTLDCPELCGMRRIEDVIASHRATGRFDPDLWWIVRFEGQPCGALLLNPCPAQDHTELVYLGVGPELRGKGVASALLHFGFAALENRPHRTVLCAVDGRNHPARKLYAREGFDEFSRRIAMVRQTGCSAAPCTGESRR